MMVVVEQLRPVALDALWRLFERVCRRSQQTRRRDPRPGEDVRFLNRRLPHEVVAVFPDALDYVHRIGVEVAVLAEPRVITEAGDVDDEHVTVPLADRIPVG